MDFNHKSAKRQAPSAKRQAPSAKRQAPSAKRQAPSAKRNGRNACNLSPQHRQRLGQVPTAQQQLPQHRRQWQQRLRRIARRNGRRGRHVLPGVQREAADAPAKVSKCGGPITPPKMGRLWSATKKQGLHLDVRPANSMNSTHRPTIRSWTQFSCQKVLFTLAYQEAVGLRSREKPGCFSWSTKGGACAPSPFQRQHGPRSIQGAARIRRCRWGTACTPDRRPAPPLSRVALSRRLGAAAGAGAPPRPSSHSRRCRRPPESYSKPGIEMAIPEPCLKNSEGRYPPFLARGLPLAFISPELRTPNSLGLRQAPTREEARVTWKDWAGLALL